MRLLARFLLLVVVVAAPVIFMLMYTDATLDSDRDAAFRADALHHAERIEADLAGLIDGGRQLASVIAQISSVQDQQPGCGGFMPTLRATLPSYESISIFAEDGDTICTTLAQPSDVLRLRNSALLRQSLQTSRFTIGAYMPATAGRAAMLPIALPYLARDKLRRGVVMLTFNLEWLHQRLAQRDIAPGASIGIADGDGTTLVRLPRDPAASFIGKAMPPGSLPYVRASRRGFVDQIGYDGRPRLIAYIPATESSGDQSNRTGLFITYSVLRTGNDGLFGRGRGRLAASVGLSLLLGLITGYIMFVRPVRALLRAAMSWSREDFAARAAVPAIPTFALLAEAFNALADAVGRDRRSLRELNLTLESRIHERTRDILESRNRLEQEIAERTRIEAELRRAQKLQVVGQLAGGIAHHFNNLLTAVIGSLDLMRRKMADPHDPHLISLIDGALQAADRGRRLTGQLLIFSRAQRMLPRPVDLNTTITQLSDLLVGTLGRFIRIDLVLAAPDSPGMGPVMVDPGQLEVALVNLAINARDAMERDGDAHGVLTITIFAVRLPGELPAGPTNAPGDYVGIEIRDTGAGIAADLLPFVFEPFFTTKPAERGSGLGLSQVHSLAVQSGGDVRIESHPGQGTTVLLLLPRAPQLAAAIAPPPAALGTTPNNKLRVLLVDDDRLVGDIIAEILTERGHDVVAASDAAEAIDLLNQEQSTARPGFDLLLTDYVMPGMNGLTLIAAARQIRPGQTALLMTGHASFQPSDTILADEVIRKPFTMTELLLRIEQSTVP